MMTDPTFNYYWNGLIDRSKVIITTSRGERRIVSQTVAYNYKRYLKSINKLWEEYREEHSTELR